MFTTKKGLVLQRRILKVDSDKIPIHLQFKLGLYMQHESPPVLFIQICVAITFVKMLNLN